MHNIIQYSKSNKILRMEPTKDESETTNRMTFSVTVISEAWPDIMAKWMWKLQMLD